MNLDLCPVQTFLVFRYNLAGHLHAYQIPLLCTSLRKAKSLALINFKAAKHLLEQLQKHAYYLTIMFPTFTTAISLTLQSCIRERELRNLTKNNHLLCCQLRRVSLNCIVLST